MEKRIDSVSWNSVMGITVKDVKCQADVERGVSENRLQMNRLGEILH